jgi:hypothetical protein
VRQRYRGGVVYSQSECGGVRSASATRWHLCAVSAVAPAASANQPGTYRCGAAGAADGVSTVTAAEPAEPAEPAAPAQPAGEKPAAAESQATAARAAESATSATAEAASSEAATQPAALSGEVRVQRARRRRLQSVWRENSSRLL